MRRYRSLHEVTESYYRDHPEEIDEFLQITFEEYAQDSDTGALLSALRIIGRVKGISALAEETGLTRQGVQKALSPNGNPRLENVNALLRAMGYRLIPRKLEGAEIK